MAPPEVTASRCAPGRAGQRAGVAVVDQPGPQLGELGGRVLAGQQVERRLERAARQRRERRAAPHRVEPVVGVDRFQRAGGDGVLGQHVERVGRHRAASRSAPPSIRCTLTAQPIRSVRCLGNSTPWEISPTWWPARPMRCSPLATDGGASTWITRSTAPMSMPSSRLEVATTARSRPLFRSSSTSARCSLVTEPWWARASSGSAPVGLAAGHDVRRAAAADPGLRSPTARRRALGVNLVEPRGESLGEPAAVGEHDRTAVCASIRSTMRSSTSGQMELFSEVGHVRHRHLHREVERLGRRRRHDGGRRRGCRTGSAPSPRAGAPWPTGRCAARGWPAAASSRSSDSARCAPRLVPATACTSSTMTVCTVASVSRAAEVSIRNSDSGVVMRMSGGLAISSRRRAGGVSPDRTPTLMSGAGSPRRSAIRAMPVSGVRRFRSTSTASALSGEM